MRRFDGLKGRFDHAEMASTGRGIGPMAVATRRAAFPGGCFVGDALCFYDGITGEGLSAAFVQAHLLAEVVPRILRGEDQAAFDRLLWATVGSKKRLAQLVLKLHDHPSLRKRVIGLFVKRPKVFEWALMKGVGTAV
jgi:flavin-dependent dehydrogenase